MQAFVHHRAQALEALLARASEVLAKYNRLDLDLAEALHAYLDECVATHRQLQRSSAENAVLAHKAQFISAQHGTHPFTLERSTSHRRELMRAVALRVLQESAEQLRNDLAQDQQRLQDAQTQLRPMVLVAVRDGFVSMKSRQPLTQKALDKLWQTIIQREDTSLAARQLAMQCSVYDIQLLLGELVSAARGLR